MSGKHKTLNADRGKIFVRTEGSYLLPNGDGFQGAVGPGRHDTPPILLMGQATGAAAQRTTSPAPSSLLLTDGHPRPLASPPSPAPRRPIPPARGRSLAQELA